VFVLWWLALSRRPSALDDGLKQQSIVTSSFFAILWNFVESAFIALWQLYLSLLLVNYYMWVVATIYGNRYVLIFVFYSSSTNPFEDDDVEDEEDFSKVDGVPIEAVFDYQAQEADELSFKKGN